VSLLVLQRDRERNTERKFKLVTNLHARIQPGREKNEKEREPTGERDGTGGREERPEEVRNFRGRDFLFSKKKIKKQKPSPQQKGSKKVIIIFKKFFFVSFFKQK